MCSRAKRMTAFVHVAIFAFCITSAISFNNVVGRSNHCEYVILGLNTSYYKGDAIHEFKLRYTEVLFTTKNDSDKRTLKGVPGIEQVDLSTELDFFKAQYSEFTRSSLTSPLKDAPISLLYTFIPISKKCFVYLRSGNNLISVSDDVSVLYTRPAYRTDVFVQTYAKGIAVEKLKHDASNLFTKWKSFCERLEANETHTPFPYPIPTTIKVHTTSMIETTLSSNSNTIDESADALSATETGSIVTVVLLVMIAAPVAIILWRYREPLRNRFERVSTR